ncbi:hypothetical protein [Actinoallomurus acanthiterrae]
MAGTLAITSAAMRTFSGVWFDSEVGGLAGLDHILDVGEVGVEDVLHLVARELGRERLGVRRGRHPCRRR